MFFEIRERTDRQTDRHAYSSQWFVLEADITISRQQIHNQSTKTVIDSEWHSRPNPLCKFSDAFTPPMRCRCECTSRRQSCTEACTSVPVTIIYRHQKDSPRSRIDVKPTTLPRKHALDSAAAAGLGRTTPHALPRWRAADNATIKTYYDRQSILNSNPNP